ncbi:MAG: GAF domain-containing protein, partial [Bacteroidetes bacterium]|nr:GAF domain-containing protein [Bacteroidota bacterium]
MNPQHLPTETVEAFEMRLRSLLGLIDQAVLLVDQDGVILDASPQTEKLLAASPAQLVQTPVELLIHPDDRQRWREKLEVLRDRDRVRDSFRVLNREHAPVHVDSVIGSAGEGRMMVVLRDVSDHYSREQELQRRNREATALFELGRRIGSSLDTGQLLDSVVKNTLWILECQFAGIVLVDAGGGGLSWSAISGSRARKRAEAAKPEIRQLSGLVMRDRKPVTLYRGDAGSTGSADASQFLEEEDLSAMCAIPLTRKESRFGMLISGYRLDHRFSDDELRFLSSLSDTATLALENARLYQDTLDSAAQLKSLSSRLSSVQEEERGRISRELHDGIGQALTAIRLNLDLLSREAAVADPRMQEKIKSIYHLIDETLEEIRTMAFELRPTVLDNVGLAGALKIYVERFSRQTGIPV